MIRMQFEDDETLVVSVDDDEIARVTHDEYGWAGIDLAQKLVLGLSRALHTPIEEL